LIKYISPGRDLIVPWKLWQIIKRIKPDLVHTHLAKAGIVGRVAAAAARVPIIMHTVHGPTFPQHFHPMKRWGFRFLERMCGRFTDCFVFVGHELNHEYIVAGTCTSDSSVVIQTGRPDTVFDRQRVSASRRVELRSQLCSGINPKMLLVTVGRLVPSKQLEDGIAVVESLHRRQVPVHLAVVGKCLLAEEQQYEIKLKKLATDLGIEQYVHFTGFRNDIIEIMESSDAVLLTSRYEGLPNVAVEAVISGSPLLSYDVSGVREIIGDRAKGVVVQQKDVEQIVVAVLQIKGRQTGGQARPRHENSDFLRQFRESVMVSRKMQLYRKTFAGTRS